jgi:predicted DNA-binding protein with PD1-like motif
MTRMLGASTKVHAHALVAWSNGAVSACGVMGREVEYRFKKVRAQIHR